ncbi:GntR family transcriptional regulator [Stella humosa]|uniref:GntR family transcriptional regulator n=1 Tax=Stella humosa TaxID=94 RepID=A0A3N1M137_9PROT|nr:GntR family transcriptional regulator [Stella humosa]ROQ01224.1 GntR family transcriptional regulator [Stella humosa]BBK31598.1 GntR family transcriptional regulator [Stella humosa]
MKQPVPAPAMEESFGPLERESLTARVYGELRTALMEGRFWPGHRLKIRELAATMRVSETPVREALMQLVRERGLEMHAGRSITVARLSLAQYLELRTIRLMLEGLAAETAALRIDTAGMAELAAVHEDLIAAERAGAWRDAIRANWRFHHRLYRAAAMPELLTLLEGLWLRNGPLLNYLYPHAMPTYAGRHQHLEVLDALARRDAAGVRDAIRADTIEGGIRLVALLEDMEAGRIALLEGGDAKAGAPA